MDEIPFSRNDVGETLLGDNDILLSCSQGIKTLSSDAAGTKRISSDRMSKILRKLVLERVPFSVAFPFVLMDVLGSAGFRYVNSDLSIFFLRKSIPPEKGCLFSAGVQCRSGNIEPLVQNAANAVSKSGFPALADQVKTILTIHLNRIVESGKVLDETDEDLFVLQILRKENCLEITVWDHGNEWRSEGKTVKNFRVNPVISSLTSNVRHKNYCGLREYVFELSVP